MKNIRVLLFILGSFSCTKTPVDDIQNADQYAVFPGAQTIFIPTYPYHSDELGRDFTVLGDGGANSLKSEESPEFQVPNIIADTLSADFGIRWNKIPARFLCIGLFDDVPTVKTLDGFAITNANHCIWLWDNSMPLDAGGLVRFKNGRSVKSVTGNIITYQDALIPLNPSTNYYLVIWAYNSDATKIEYSSHLIRINIAKP